MDAKKCLKIYNKLFSNLEIVFRSKEVLMHLTNENFKDLILNQVSILNFLEKEIPSTTLQKETNKRKDSDLKKADDFLNKLNLILSSDKTFLTLNFSNETEVEDEVNYLGVYIKNAFNKDLEEFKKTPTSNPETVKAEFANNSTNAAPQGTNASAKGGFGFGGGFGGMGATPGVDPSLDPKLYQEQFYYQIANRKLQADIASGTFYMFKTKPMIVPILKKVIGGLAGLHCLLTLIATILLGISSGNLQINTKWMVDANLWTQQYYDAINGGGETGKNILLSAALGNTMTMDYIMQALIMLIGGYCCYSLLIKKVTNENAKFNFNWLYAIFFIIYLVFTVVQIITTIQGYYKILDYYLHDSSAASINGANIKTYAPVFAGSVYLITTCYSILGVMLIAVIVAAAMAPKRDMERIQLKLQEYVSEIRSASGNAPF